MANRLLAGLIRLYHLTKIMVGHYRQLQVRFSDPEALGYIENLRLILLFYEKFTEELLTRLSAAAASPFQFMLFKIFIDVSRFREDLQLHSTETVKRISSEENMAPLMYKLIYEN